MADSKSIDSAATTVAALRDAGDDMGVRELAERLGRDDPDALVAIALPGARLAGDLELRIAPARPTKYRQDSYDLELELTLEGTGVQLASRRGAEAVAALSPASLAPVHRVCVAYGEQAAWSALEGVRFDRVTEISLCNVPLPLQTAALATCPNAIDVSADELSDEALATIAGSAVTNLYLAAATDVQLTAISTMAALESLTVRRFGAASPFTATGLSTLGTCRRLRSLRASSCALTDGEVRAIAELVRIEELYLGANPFGDHAGVALATLVALRNLDLHDTCVGDETVAALARLPALEALDLADARVSPTGIRALSACTTLRRLGLAWQDHDANAAAATLSGVTIEENDYFSRGGALFDHIGFYGP